MIQKHTKENEIKKVLGEWAKYIVEIGLAYKNNQDFENIADELFKKLYAFNEGNVLFKPTMAKVAQFRTKKEEFYSYFLGINNVCKEDKGFALKPWKEIKFENYDSSTYGNIILTMGNYFFKDYKNNIVQAEYTFGFLKLDENQLKIILHHSSLVTN